MIFENLILNNEIWSKLQNAFKNKKIPNAYIFSGIEGIGKEAHAIEFAALLNCKRITGDGNACGDCRACIRIKSFQHEEIHYIRPLPTQKSKTELDANLVEEINQFYKRKSKNPYHKMELKNANIISINTIRAIKKKLFYTKGDGDWSIVIITEAEKLCSKKAEAANSLLKILEEPPDKTLFILLTSKINLITETILSRCQKHYFPKIQDSILKKFIVEQNFGKDINEGYIELSHGSINELQNIIDTKRIDNLKEVIECFYSTEIINIEKFLSIMKEINTKNDFLKYIHHLKVCTKDLYQLSESNSNKLIEYKFLYNKYNEILNLFPKSSWIEIINLLNECSRDFSNNVNFTLSLYALIINIQYCLKGDKKHISRLEVIKEL